MSCRTITRRLLLSTCLLSAVMTGTGCTGDQGVPVPDDGGVLDMSPTQPVPMAFAPIISRPSGNRPSAIVAEDINGDGGPELIVANQGDNTVTVLLHNQDYRATAAYPTAIAPSAIAIADINLDGRKDLLVACSNNAYEDLSVLRGNGIGAFLPPVNLALGSAATGVSAGDFNGDGKVDVAVSVRSQGKVYTLLNSSLGVEVAFALPYGSYDVGNEPVALLTADLNRDGHADLVTANYRDNQIGALIGTSPSTFERPIKAAWVGAGPIALATGNLLGDTNLDLAVANMDDRTISLLKGRGDGTFASLLTLPTAAKPTSVGIADMDRDGRPDLVVANSGANQIAVLLATGDGTFAPPQVFSVGEQPFALAIADLDLDGRLDVATANLAGGDVSILYNRTAR